MNSALGVTLRPLVEDDLGAYLLLRDHAWGYPNGEAARAAMRERLPGALGAFDETGRLLASAAGPHFEAFVARRRVRLLGIAAVQTLPTARRRGLAAALLERLLADARDAGLGWSLLYPFDPRFYARLGWQALPSGVRLSMSTRWWARPEPVEAEQVSGDLRAALQALHLRCAAAWSFSNARTMGPRDTWTTLRPEPGQRGAAFRVEDGYAVVRLTETSAQHLTLQVLDAAWCSAAGRRNVLGLLGSYQGQVQRIELEVPRDDALAWDWSTWWTTASNTTPMARIVDLPAALAAVGAVSDLPTVTVRVRDRWAPWNDGTWRLTPASDGCAVNAVASGADASLDVRALPLLLGGAATPDAVVRAGLAEGMTAPLAVLAALAGGVTPHHRLADYF